MADMILAGTYVFRRRQYYDYASAHIFGNDTDVETLCGQVPEDPEWPAKLESGWLICERCRVEYRKALEAETFRYYAWIQMAS